MELAEKRAGKTPKVVVTDRLKSYLEGIEQAYGANTKHHHFQEVAIQEDVKNAIFHAPS